MKTVKMLVVGNKREFLNSSFEEIQTIDISCVTTEEMLQLKAATTEQDNDILFALRCRLDSAFTDELHYWYETSGATGYTGWAGHAALHAEMARRFNRTKV